MTAPGTYSGSVSGREQQPLARDRVAHERVRGGQA